MSSPPFLTPCASVLPRFFTIVSACLLLLASTDAGEIKTIKGTVTDVDGAPWAEIEIAPKWRQSISTGEINLTVQQPETNGYAVSSDNGTFSMPMMANWWEGILAYDRDRTVGAVAIVPKTEAPQDLQLILKPLVRVTAKIESESPEYLLKRASVSIYFQPPGDRFYSQILYTSTITHTFLLPPGTYRIEVSAGPKFDRVNRTFTITGEQSTHDLGSVAIPPSPWAALADQPAPPLEFSDLRGLPQDTTWESLRGKWVLLIFWGHWCAPCHREMQPILPFYRANLARRHEFEIIAIHASDAKTFEIIDQKMPAIAGKYWEDHPLPFPIALDAERRIQQAYGIRLLPTHILVDPTGKIVTRPGGPAAFTELKTKLRAR